MGLDCYLTRITHLDEITDTDIKLTPLQEQFLDRSGDESNTLTLIARAGIGYWRRNWELNTFIKKHMNHATNPKFDDVIPIKITLQELIDMRNEPDIKETGVANTIDAELEFLSTTITEKFADIVANPDNYEDESCPVSYEYLAWW